MFEVSTDPSNSVKAEEVWKASTSKLNTWQKRHEIAFVIMKTRVGRLILLFCDFLLGHTMWRIWSWQLPFFLGKTWSNNSLSIARVELCHIILEDQMAHQSPIRCTKRCPSHCCWWYHHCWWLTLFWAWNHMVYTLFCCCSNWFVSSCFLFGTLAFSMPAQGCCSHLGRPRPSRSLKRKRRSQRRNRRRNQRRYPQMSLGRGIELAVSTYQWKIGISFTKRGV